MPNAMVMLPCGAVGDQVGADEAWALSPELRDLLLGEVPTAEDVADRDHDPVELDVVAVELQAGVADRHRGRHQRELREAGGALDGAQVEVVVGIEVDDLAAELAGDHRGVEASDAPGARPPRCDVLPEAVHAGAGRRDRSHPRDDNTAHGSSQDRSRTPAWRPANPLPVLSTTSPCQSRPPFGT